MASNYTNGLYKDYEKLQINYDKLNQNYKLLKLRAELAESAQQRLEKTVSEKEDVIDKKEEIIKTQEQTIIELKKQLAMAIYDRDHYLSKLTTDGTNSGIPTSQTPINKKKVIPNSRQKTNCKLGGQPGHKRHVLEHFSDEEVNEHEYVTLDTCPYCHCDNLVELDSEVIKDVLDYKIKIIKRRIHYRKYKCPDCQRIVKKAIPQKYKEAKQYGDHVQATALTLTNMGNVPINKVQRIINGLTMDEINLSESFISKLQKRGAKKLEKFIDDLKFYITKLNLVYWDDTVVMINTSRGCMRFYGNEDVALYCAHAHKNREGLDQDNILNLLTPNTTVMHDHNIVNYNKDYSFINIECCQHLIRDLQRVSDNLPDRTWSSKTKSLFQEYDHERNTLIAEGIDHFSNDQFDAFLNRFNEYLLLGIEENLNDPETYYASDEATLIIRLIEYRDNYIYWLLDFNLPFTNSLSERGVRDLKSKMKVSGQFQNVEMASCYASIKSYVETCHRNGVNEHEALVKLMEDNPYSLTEILEAGKQNVEKKSIDNAPFDVDLCL